MSVGADRCARFRHDRLSAVWSALGDDILRFATFNPDYRPRMGLRKRLSILLQPPLLCLCFHRLAHYFWVRGWHRLARALSTFSHFIHKAHIAPDSCIGPGCFLGHTAGTTFIGSAGQGLTLFSLAVCCPSGERLGYAADDGPRLGDHVTLAGHSVVIGRISVGDGARLAPKSRLGIDCPDRMDVLSSRLRHTLVTTD
ncbi:MAG: hypothetical protein ACRENQ_08855 [Gemmatimonadaceae bacterium]